MCLCLCLRRVRLCVRGRGEINMSILDRVKGWFEPPHPLTSGIYSYQTPPDAPQQFRLHLRVEKDGHGVLLVNAAKMLHLNQTATELASFILQEKTADEAAY